MQNVKLIVMDVDGTLTDGTLLYGEHGEQEKRFHAADGLGIVMAQGVGLRFAVISGRENAGVRKRMTELLVADVIEQCGDKAAALSALQRKYDLQTEEIAFVGDDLNDLPAFAVAGVKIAVANAASQLREQADYITPRAGGHGGVRDAIEEILRRQGRLDEAVQAYITRSALKDTARQ